MNYTAAGILSAVFKTEPTMAQIYLVRHGQASFGSSNYDQLSELGFEQARLLGRHGGRANLTFADGHAEGQQTNKTWRTLSDNDWRRYQVVDDIR